MTREFAGRLPIDDVLPELCKSLCTQGNLVLAAPPGAGKTTRVPLVLLDAVWRRGGKIILLEPRRLAARAAASRMADSLGETVGETVGLRMRLESKISSKTCIEVVTEGVFARMILDDPELGGVACVLFDEFHERSLDADLGLALALDAQGAFRPDLRLVVMSATLDGARVAGLMGGGPQKHEVRAPLIESAGHAFPVETIYIGRDPAHRMEECVARAILRALAEQEGSILAFLPGQAEIRRVATLLAERRLPATVELTPLYGALERAEQDRAIAKTGPGVRKIVLATSIAETSLTIDGVRIVIDCGLARVPVFEPDLGLTRLETMRASRANVDQRRGRAGRTEPGVCYRLWEEAATASLPAFASPEIFAADLSGLVLDLASWGVSDPTSLAFLDPPPRPAWAEAVALTKELGALNAVARLTPRGEAIRALPLPPRLACMVIEAANHECAGRAAQLAMLLSERGLGGIDLDLSTRLERLRGDAGQRARDARRLAANWARQADAAREAPAKAPLSDGAMLALAFPDRIAKARGGGDFLMVNGRAASLPPDHPLSREAFLAIAEIAGRAGRARVLAACALTLEELETQASARIETREETLFDPVSASLRRRRFRRLGAIRLSEQNLSVEPTLENARILARAAASAGIDRLPWSKAQSQMRDRVIFLRGAEGNIWPDLTGSALGPSAEEWLAPFIIGRTNLAGIGAEDLDAALTTLLPYELARRLDMEAPAFFDTPAGSRVALDYAAPNGPLLSVRVQELYGLAQHPTLARGRAPITLELLSPAHRPIQTTRDLPGFWAGSWNEVRKEMKGRYPRHSWPDDPALAAPTTRARSRS